MGADQTQEPQLESSRADRIEKFLAVYLKESMLWPVFVAMAAHVWVALSAVLLLVVRDQNPVALFPLVVAFVGSAALVRYGFGRSHRVIPALVLSAWVIAALIAWLANHFDVY